LLAKIQRTSSNLPLFPLLALNLQKCAFSDSRRCYFQRIDFADPVLEEVLGLKQDVSEMIFRKAAVADPMGPIKFDLCMWIPLPLQNTH